MIASQRSLAFAEHFSAAGFDISVLTHQWIEKAGNWEIANGKEPMIVEENGYRVLRVALDTETWVQESTSSIQTLQSYSKGIFEVDETNLNAYSSLKSFLFPHLEKESYDFIMTSYSPHHNIRLCYEAAEKFDIPYHIDFRDLWNHLLLKADYSPKAAERVQNFYIRKYWKKWLKNAHSCTVISEAVGSYLDDLSSVRKIVLLNGYEENIFNGIAKEDTGYFVICHCGSLYPFQDISLFFKGVKLFLNSNDCPELKVRFVGVKSEEMRDRILRGIEVESLQSRVELLPRLSRRDALQEMKNSSLLFFPGWEGIPGGYSGKIFEYMASGIPILVAPNDFDVVESLMEETQAGFVTPKQDPHEVSKFIREIYQAWRKGEKPFKPKLDEVLKYTRKKQVGKLISIIKDY